jgi:hypothetical protein
MLRMCFAAITVLMLAARAANQPQVRAHPWKPVTQGPADNHSFEECAHKPSLQKLWSSCLAR